MINCGVMIAASSVVFSDMPEIEAIENCNCSTLVNGNEYTPKQRAKKINEQGMAAYNKKDFLRAARLFFCAATTDPANPLAHYNYACALSLLSAGIKDVCSRPYAGVIQDSLIKSIKLDPSRREKMIADADFKAIRDEHYFKMLCISPATPLRVVLTKYEWYGPKSIYPATPKVRFNEDGTVEVRHFRIPDGENGIERAGFDAPVKGTYTMDAKNMITVKISGHNASQWKGTLHYRFEEGILWEMEINFTVSFHDSDETETLYLNLNDDPCAI